MADAQGASHLTYEGTRWPSIAAICGRGSGLGLLFCLRLLFLGLHSLGLGGSLRFGSSFGLGSSLLGGLGLNLLTQLLAGSLNLFNLCLQTYYLFILKLYLVALVADSGKQRLEFLIVDVLRLKVVDPVDEVAEDVHIVVERIEGAGIDTSIHCHSRRFGGDEVEVIGSLQIVPVLVDTWVVSDAHAVGYAVELVESLALHGVTQPARHIALLVHP